MNIIFYICIFVSISFKLTLISGNPQGFIPRPVQPPLTERNGIPPKLPQGNGNMNIGNDNGNDNQSSRNGNCNDGNNNGNENMGPLNGNGDCGNNSGIIIGHGNRNIGNNNGNNNSGLGNGISNPIIGNPPGGAYIPPPVKPPLRQETVIGNGNSNSGLGNGISNPIVGNRQGGGNERGSRKKKCRGRKYGDADCCSKTSTCDVGEGDCDSNSECTGHLVCGNDNCKQFGNFFSSNDDCCQTPGSVKKSRVLRGNGNRNKGSMNGNTNSFNGQNSIGSGNNNFGNSNGNRIGTKCAKVIHKVYPGRRVYNPWGYCVCFC